MNPVPALADVALMGPTEPVFVVKRSSSRVASMASSASSTSSHVAGRPSGFGSSMRAISAWNALGRPSVGTGGGVCARQTWTAMDNAGPS